MTTIESLNNKLTHGGVINSPFYFEKGTLHDIELSSDTMAGAAYPMAVSFNLSAKSINQAIKLLHARFDFARSRDTDNDFYDIFEAKLIKLLSGLK